MIQRRRPIESAIAERKMFNMGGMAAPMQQPTYMDLMQQGIMGMPQQPMGMPQQPQGIMASSQPLVDAIAADANNPYGGDTLSMAQGGIAKFQQGGTTVSLEQPFAPGKGPRTFIGMGEPPEDILRRRDAKPSELVNEMFPYSASTGRSFMGPLMMRPGIVGTDTRGGESSPIERSGQFVADFIDQAARGLSQVSNSLGRTMVDIGEGFVTRAPKDVGTATIISQVSAVNDALRRMPKVLGVSDEELGATIKDIAEASTTAQPGISGDELSARIAEGVLSKYEGPASEGYAMARDDAGRRTVDASPEDGFPTPLGFEMAAEDANRTLADGVAEAPVTEGESIGDAPRPKEKPPIPQGPFDVEGEIDPDAGLLVETEAPVGGVLDGEDAAAYTAANQAASILDTDKKADGKTIDDFKKKFMEAMPKYEGMSEEEKGFLIAEAGLRVMAGKDPNAIVNIAEGLKGLGPALMKGAKEERAWKRQVELSAAKYGLENVAREAAEDRADERKVFFFYDQTKKTKDNPYGPMVTVSMADIVANGGKIPEGLVEKDLVSKSIANANASTLRLQKLITDNARVYRIGSAEAKSLKEELGTARTALVSGQIGIDLLSTVKAQVAEGNITGLGNAGKELYRRAFASVNLDVNKKYKNISAARADIRRAFQSLIPLSLGSTQTANSISNRDVQFLADAYINSGFLKDGILSFATVDSTALGKQLDGAIGKFRESQKQGLATYNRVLERIDSAERGVSGASALGVPVSPGPFGRKYFQGTIEDIRPYAESTRTRLEGGRVKPIFTPKSFGALKDYDFIDGKYVPKGSR